MKLYRSGARRFQKWDQIIKSTDDTKIRQSKTELVLSAKYVPDIHGNGLYDWDIHLSLSDVAKIIEYAADAMYKDHPKELQQALKDSAIALTKLSMCACGYPPPPQDVSNSSKTAPLVSDN